jgi:hypothetical protein
MHKILPVYILLTIISCAILLSGCKKEYSAESTLAAAISTVDDTITKKAQANNSVSIADSATVSATVSSGTGTSTPDKKQDEKVKKADSPKGITEKVNPPKNKNTAPTTSASISEVVPDKVDEKVNSIAAKDVSDEDLIAVISIVNGKLTMDELDYLFNSAKSDYWVNTSVEDIKKAREILFSKLSDSDINALTTIGNKYGKGMDILKKDLDIAKTKEAKMKAKD